MSPTADSGPTGPRLRARARTTAAEGVPPEVAEALGSLERSIGDVTEWEQLLAGTSGDDVAGGGGGGGEDAIPAAPSPADLVVLAHVTPGAADAASTEPTAQGATPSAGPPDPSGLDLALPLGPRGGPMAAPELEPNLDLAPLFAEAEDPDPLAGLFATASSPGGLRPDQRRRRNGRILSWVGAILLVAVAAVWLLPDNSSPDKTVVRDTTTSLETTTTRAPLDGPTFPTLPSTTLPVAPTAPVTVPATTATTVRKTTPRAATTTAPPATTTTVAPPVVTTTTVPAATTTTQPPTTSTTCAVGGEPDPIHGTC